MFCLHCTDFVTHWSQSAIPSVQGDGTFALTPFTFPLHESIQQLKDASDKACNICRNIWCCLTEREQVAIAQNPTASVSISVNIDQGKPILKASYHGIKEQVQSTHMFAMFLRQDTKLRLSSVLRECHNGLDRTSTGAESSFKIAHYWLSECLEKHELCPKPTRYLPTRVLDVGTGQQAFVRLVETKELDEVDQALPYVALSHCWGKDRFKITTLENLAEGKAGIPLSDLPPSFQDAVQAVRRMQMRFLWIDSLCIIQDSKEDWERESVQMCQIYARATFTVTSAHASGAYGGMFVRRDGIRTLPFEIDIESPGQAIRLMFLPTPRRQIVWDTSDLPLYTRAWCFQELVLSVRNLIFDPDGVRWECLSTSGSERDPEGGIRRHHASIRDVQLAISSQTNADQASEVHGDEVQQSIVWQHILEDYSKRRLTKYTDKLIAIAGVAEALQMRTNDVYAAGIWARTFYLQLPWYVRHLSNPVSSNITQADHPPPYREKDPVAPTWSWASVDVPINFEVSATMERMCRMLSISMQGTPQLQNGKIAIEGDVRVLYVSQSNENLMVELDRVYQKVKFRNSAGLMEGLMDRDVAMLASQEPPSRFRSVQALPVRWYPDEIVDENTAVTFLAISRKPRLSGMSVALRHQLIFTLAVVPTSREPNEYRRVGLAIWDDCSWFGFSCSEDREMKVDSYRKMSRRWWSKIKPPNLCDGTLHSHPVEYIEGHASQGAYHSSVDMRRTTITIV